MDKQKNYLPSAGLAISLALFIGAIVWTAAHYVQTSARVAQAQREYQTMEQRVSGLRIATLEKQVGLLVSNNKTVQSQLAAESVKRQQAEQAQASGQALAQQQITRLNQQLTAAKEPDISSLVHTWRPRVASINCRFDFANGTSATDRGSAVLISTAPDYTVATNSHVVVYQGVRATSCTVHFPDDPESSVSGSSAIRPSPTGIDWALVTIKPTKVLLSTAPGAAPRCTRRANAGESILILGYPSIGAQNDVTATEGIISGFENEYYITSAKVERGNSGGAAILSKENCYLGIPSYVGSGEIESLARVLEQSYVGK